MINPETKEPLVEFPTHFLFKITGKNDEKFEETILNLLRKVDPNIDASKIKRTMSKTDKYLSLSVEVYVEHQDHIDQVYALLKSEDKVLWAL